jgi:hypothetical protein
MKDGKGRVGCPSCFPPIDRLSLGFVFSIEKEAVMKQIETVFPVLRRVAQADLRRAQRTTHNAQRTTHNAQRTTKNMKIFSVIVNNR